jgi:mRNA interferase MazF
VTYSSFDVVVVPFPFTEVPRAKRRPALVLSSGPAFGDRVGHSVMAMITSAANAPWPLDTPIDQLAEAGLTAPSVVRMKLFTLDHRLIFRKLGALGEADAQRVAAAMRGLFGW